MYNYKLLGDCNLFRSVLLFLFGDLVTMAATSFHKFSGVAECNNCFVGSNN